MGHRIPLLDEEPRPRPRTRVHKRTRIARYFKQFATFVTKLFVIGLFTISGEACMVRRSIGGWFPRPRSPPSRSRTTAPDLDITHTKTDVEIFTGHVTGRGNGAANDAPPPPRTGLSTPPPTGVLFANQPANPPASPNPSLGSTGLSVNPKKRAGYERLHDADIDIPPVNTPSKPNSATGKQVPVADVPPAPRLGKSNKPPPLDTGTVPKKPKLKVVPDDSMVDLPPVTVPPIPRNEIVLPPTSPPLWRRAMNKAGDFAYQSGIQTLSAGLSSTPFYVMSTLQQPPPPLPPPVTINNQRHYPQVPYPYHVQQKAPPTVPASPQLGTKTLPSYQAPEQIRLGSKPTTVPVVNPAPNVNTAVTVKTPPAPTKLPKIIPPPTPVPHFFTRTLDTCQRNIRVCQALSMATAAVIATAATASVYEIRDIDREDDIQLLAWLYRFLQQIADETGKTLAEVLHIVENFPPDRINQAHIIASSLEEAQDFRKRHNLPLDFEYTAQEADINLKFLDFVQILMATRGQELLSYIQKTMKEILIREPHLLVQPQPPTNIPEF